MDQLTEMLGEAIRRKTMEVAGEYQDKGLGARDLQVCMFFRRIYYCNGDGTIATQKHVTKTSFFLKYETTSMSCSF